jgi:hypothetical protein
MSFVKIWFAGVLSLGLWIVTSVAARANDSMAVFGAGGLQFERTDELRMTSEDLYLGPLEVRVTYYFQNLTDHDVSGTVAFPLPEVNVMRMSEAPHKFHPSYLDGDIFDFHVVVNGQLIKPQSDIRAFVEGPNGIEKDVTELLRKYRLSTVEPAFGGLNADAIKELVAAGVLMDDELNHPLWSVRTTFHWRQVFPARKGTFIEHRYKPVLGSSRIFNAIEDRDSRDRLAPWCPDKGFARAAKALPADENAMLLTNELEYILKTGANWAGPIGKFRLEINKAGADLLSLCPLPGLKLERRGQSFVAEAAQYTPTADIKLLFVYRACDKEPCGLNAEFPGYPR